MKNITEFKKKIEKERIALFGKDDIKRGYFEQPETWAHTNGQFRSYLWQMSGKPTTNIMAIHDLWLAKTKDATNSVQNLLDNDWLNLSEELIAELPPNIFPR